MSICAICQDSPIDQEAEDTMNLCKLHQQLIDGGYIFFIGVENASNPELFMDFPNNIHRVRKPMAIQVLHPSLDNVQSWGLINYVPEESYQELEDLQTRH